MKLFKTAFLMVAALVVTACGAKNNYPDPVDPRGSSTPVEHSAVSENIGPSGGQVIDFEGNIAINIPSGALSKETTITATYIESPEILSTGLPTEFLGAVEFGPDGTKFNKPVSVTINLTKAPKNSKLAVFCYYAKEDIWEYVTDATPKSGQKATFEVTHFSKYHVMDRTKDFLNEYTNIVKAAKANGLSDEEITQEFRNYLVNEKHVMDQYTTYDGYWYEPCGLKISGNYQIDGKKGDPNDLIKHEGESNKVGNKYGLCTIDGGHASREDEKKASSSSEVIDVLVVVEYKIINPDIDLTPSKKQLKKGESATIKVRCHYTNPSNYFYEYKDLDLSGYFLTVKRPENFSVDRSGLVTDDEGQASFVVTAEKNSKAETITVNFDVPGDFGTHAEGNTTLNSTGGYQISGSVSEGYKFNYEPGMYYMGQTIIEQRGEFNLKLTYDFEATLQDGDTGMLQGTLNISNIKLTLESKALKFTVEDEVNGTPAYYDYEVDYFKNKNKATTTNFSTDVYATEHNDGTYGLIALDLDTIASQTGTSYEHDVIRVPAAGINDAEDGESFDFKVEVTTDTMLSLAFDLTPGTKEYSQPMMLDTVDITFIVDQYKVDIDEYDGSEFSYPEEYTSQVITVSQM